MIFGSVCSGIEAASVAWHPLGWRAAFLSEIEAFPRAVLQHHYPDTPLHGDFTTIEAGMYEPIDLLVGGTPCQSFSVAGLRGGLDDERGNLALQFLRLADRLRPRWVVWENVPGVLSSSGGRDFGAILGGLAELGYGWAYRILDAQYAGVPQRRRRVFVVGYSGDWRRAAAVLFERHSLSGHPAPRRETGESATGTLASRAGAGGGLGTDMDLAGGVTVAPCLRSNQHNNSDAGMESRMLVMSHDPAVTLCARERKGALPEADLSTIIAHALRADGFDASEDGTGRGTPLVAVPFTNRGLATDGAAERLRSASHGALPMVAHAVVSNGDAHSGFRDEHGIIPVAFQEAQTGCREYDSAGTLRAGGPGHDPVGTRIREGMAVRRLTPRECERLQGFSDDYTLIPEKRVRRERLLSPRAGKSYREIKGEVWQLAADGPRYKALGNSMAVPCMAWIGERIELVEAVIAAECAA